MKEYLLTAGPTPVPERVLLAMAGSGTVGMDAAVCNFLRTGDKAIVIRGGKFGERWGRICQAYGIECVFIDVEWGKSVDAKVVADTLKKNPGVRAVYATACETSTATKHDIEAIGKV